MVFAGKGLYNGGRPFCRSFLLFSFCQLAFATCSLRRWVLPNPAFSGHGYAVGQRWRFEGGVTPPTMLLGKHAAPLTRSLG